MYEAWVWVASLPVAAPSHFVVLQSHALFHLVETMSIKPFFIGTQLANHVLKKGDVMMRVMMIAVVAAMFSCAGIPEGAVAVRPFDKERYLGKWYEMARFDYRFERDLNNVTATYSLNDNGMIRVDNKGYNVKEGKWKQSIGKATFAGRSDEGRLKVSFFGPFYSGYNVLAVDEHYRYALVAGRNLDYLWILSREKSIPELVKEEYLKMAQELGYDTNKLVWVAHDRDLSVVKR
jgi:apolipoprotein D and lipocalin family protein